ncbi:MAG: putative lipid II flippase FtsW [Patescibacteria group bacterium]|nr:putative lipid II flippase FtsW [Patescibacteria group bacterium]
MTKKQTKLDYGLLGLVLLLLIFGLTILYSASTVESFKNFGNSTYYIYHQLLYGGLLGLIAMLILSKVDYHVWQKILPVFLLATLALLGAVKVPGLGFGAGGAERWVHIGPIFFQPSELAKLAIIFYIASWADKRKVNDFSFGLLPSLVVIALYALLILWQPDLGTMLVLVSIAAAMLFASGISWKYFFWTVVSTLLLLYAVIKLEPYRAKRLLVFLNPQSDPQGIGYHINQALLAVGSGWLFGYGYGLSRQKHNYLPQVMNDSIFAVAAEELGFFRILILLVLFGLFALKGFSVAKNAPDTFGRMTALGITFWIIIQAVINIGAMVNLLPLTGIPLPFFSYGSTSLLVNLSAIGIMLNIARQSA